MIPSRLVILAILAAVGSGLIAGTFFAFSTFVMRSLGRLPAPQGIAAMQSINVVVLNPLFLGVFLGTAGLCFVLGGTGAMRWGDPAAGLLLGASLLYLVGTVGVTVAGNVPLNDALAVVAPESGAEFWARYLREWTLWNHVRTIAAIGAMLGFILAARRLAEGRPVAPPSVAEAVSRGVR